MAKIQFNRAVRIAPRAGKGGPKVFAAGAVVDISDPEILNHPHFKKFERAGALEKYVPKAPPKALPPSELGKAKANPSAVDGRVKLPGKGGQLKEQADKKATQVEPETTVGDDGEDDKKEKRKSK